MEKTNVRRTGRKPKSDPADYRYSFRLNAGENSRFEQMLAESGAKDRTLFIKKAIFGGTLKVVKTDKATWTITSDLRNSTDSSGPSETTTTRLSVH